MLMIIIMETVADWWWLLISSVFYFHSILTGNIATDTEYWLQDTGRQYEEIGNYTVLPLLPGICRTQIKTTRVLLQPEIK